MNPLIEHSKERHCAYKGARNRMEKVVWKCFFIWDYDKQEAWLNRMSAKGLHLQAVSSWKYVFEKGLPSEYIYCIIRFEKSPNERVNYIRSIVDNGAEHISTCRNWIYFRKKSGKFELFLDFESHINHLNRVLWTTGIYSFINGINAFFQFSSWRSSERLSNLMLATLCLIVSILSCYGFLRHFFRKRRIKIEHGDGIEIS